MRIVINLALSILCVSAVPDMNAQCNAGSDATAQYCSDAAPVDLLGVLGGFPATSGSWSDPSGGAFSGIFDPASDIPGTHWYVVTTNSDGSSCGLADTAFVTVGVTTIPLVSFSIDNTSGCGSVSVNYIDNTTATGFTFYDWDFGDGSGSFDDTPFHTYQDTSGCFDVSLTRRNSAGCEATDTLVNAVCVQSRPDAAFSLLIDPVLTNAPTARFINESTGAALYDWDVPGIGNFNAENPEVVLPAYEADYNVCLDAMSADGCIDTFCKRVRVRQNNEIFVPSAFTADEDNLNRTFKPVLTFDPDNYVLTVFDRWGSIVFESRLPTLGWNGTHQDSEFIAPDGDYTWKIRATKNAKVIERFGNVTLIR